MGYRSHCATSRSSARASLRAAKGSSALRNIYALQPKPHRSERGRSIHKLALATGPRSSEQSLVCPKIPWPTISSFLRSSIQETDAVRRLDDVGHFLGYAVHYSV